MCKGSRSTREARHRQYNDMLGSRYQPGSPMQKVREARRIGRPTTKINRDGEAGPRRRPQCDVGGSPSTRKAQHRRYNDIHGSRSTPEAKRNATERPVEAGGP